MFLRNYNKYNELLSVSDNKIFISDDSKIVTVGFFITSNIDRLGIYVFQNDIKIKINNNDIFLKNIKDIYYQSNELILINENNECIGRYENSNLKCKTNINPFFNEEEEDFDLCLLILNIFQNKSRQLIFINNNS